MSVPSFFIVGAPRCGTTSLAAYLGAHPRLFLSNPKEPHHFGKDIAMRFRPYADEKRYLRLFDAAGERVSGEASVLYLYSQSAPGEILALNPAARAVILLRDPVEMVASLHAHNVLLGYEDLTDLSEAVAAEPARRAGQRVPWSCLMPLALQYTRLGCYAEGVERYLEAFGRERVLCLLLSDLKREPARVYQETLRFLGVEPAPPPSFKVHNEQKRWKSPRLGRVVMGTTTWAVAHGMDLPTKPLRALAVAPFAIAMALAARFGVTAAPAAPVPPALRETLRAAFRDDVVRLGRVLDRDLSGWLADPAA